MKSRNEKLYELGDSKLVVKLCYVHGDIGVVQDILTGETEICYDWFTVKEVGTIDMIHDFENLKIKER